MPQVVAQLIPFEQDRDHAAYNPEYAQLIRWQSLILLDEWRSKRYTAMTIALILSELT
ncbi:hypothetical protein [Chroococcidiopsis cubana]|uniref:hypothetical protein n=1 Tax=Chroococcidiopsis cubana TaxID=171392 RepID=UPI001315234E|nr:hypothetical protein [Chroococcidiopsis cubana]